MNFYEAGKSAGPVWAPGRNPISGQRPARERYAVAVPGRASGSSTQKHAPVPEAGSRAEALPPWDSATSRTT